MPEKAMEGSGRHRDTLQGPTPLQARHAAISHPSPILCLQDEILSDPAAHSPGRSPSPTGSEPPRPRCTGTRMHSGRSDLQQLQPITEHGPLHTPWRHARALPGIPAHRAREHHGQQLQRERELASEGQGYRRPAAFTLCRHSRAAMHGQGLAPTATCRARRANETKHTPPPRRGTWNHSGRPWAAAGSNVWETGKPMDGRKAAARSARVRGAGRPAARGYRPRGEAGGPSYRATAGGSRNAPGIPGFNNFFIPPLQY